MFELADLQRKIQNIIRIGTVSEIDGKRARVKFDNNETDLLQWTEISAGKVKKWTPKTIGEQVVIASEGGETTQGIIIGSLSSNQFPVPTTDDGIEVIEYADGAVISYDFENSILKAILPDSGTAIIDAKGGTTWHGKVTFMDEITCKKDITSEKNLIDFRRSLEQDREILDGQGHPALNAPPASSQRLRT